MEIQLQTKIAALLEAYPSLEGTLLEMSPAFAKLRNPVLRRTVAKVADLRQAAKIAGISPVVMLQTLRQAANLPVDDDCTENNVKTVTANKPEWFDEAKIAVRFNAIPFIESGQNPVQHIIRLSEHLKAGEIMELTAPFKPVPVIEILESKDFDTFYFQEKTYLTKRNRLTT